MGDRFDWDDAALAKLRQLWCNGVSTGKIAVAMNTTKNAIVGKVHRLNLPARPSPISRLPRADGAPAAPRVLTRVEREANARAAVPVVSDSGVMARVPVMAAGPAVRPLGVARGRAKKCCFPFGESGKPNFRFCDAAVYTALSYCDEHAAICFERVRDRREDHA